MRTGCSDQAAGRSKASCCSSSAAVTVPGMDCMAFVFSGPGMQTGHCTNKLDAEFFNLQAEKSAAAVGQSSPCDMSLTAMWIVPRLDDGTHISRDACRLVAQLARTEEAAKRCMVHNDSSARGGVAQRVLDLERQLSRTQANQAEADAKFAREKKRAQDQKARAEELQKRLDAVLRDQRRLVQRVGHAESRR